jgi:2-dehydropantoate 2-reductase
MREDFRQGKPTEIDAINGYIVQQGQKLGIATPVNQLLVQTIKGQTP